MKLKKLEYLALAFLLVVCLVIPTVISAPPVTTVTSANTNIQIIHYPFEYIKQNANLYLRFWTFNSTVGSPLTNTSIYCAVNVFEPQGKNTYKTLLSSAQYGISGDDKCKTCWWVDIAGSNFSKIGVYGLNIRCDTFDNKTLGGDVMIPMQVTASGYGLDVSQSIIYFTALMISLFLFSLSLFFSITIPFRNTRDDDGRIVSINKMKYLKLVLMGLTYMLLLLIVGITRGITANFLYLTGISNIFNWIYWIMLSLMFPAIVVIFIGIIVFLAEDKILNQRNKRGGHFR